MTCAQANSFISNMFDSAIFTFNLGPEAKCFHVHNDIVASRSDALSAMMNNQHFKESSENVAVLEEVDAQTFSNFWSLHTLEPIVYFRHHTRKTAFECLTRCPGRQMIKGNCTGAM